MDNTNYLYSPDKVKERLDKNYFLDKKLGFNVIEHGTILPHKDTNGKFSGALGGVVYSNGKFVTNSYVYEPSGDKRYTPPPNQFATVMKP